MSKVIDAVRDTIKNIVEAHGMELVDIEYKKLYDAMTLIVYIDKDGGVDLNDCETIHRAIDQPLDDIDPTGGQPYNLNVSSPGLDRPYKTERDFAKNIGNEVEVSLYKPVDKLKKFEATLTDYRDGIVTLEYKNKTINLNIKDVAVIRTAIKF
ncbi:MAG: ribosome maturation factor RimP [Christensenellales bacterium]